MINENEIARCVRRTLDGYFRDLDGEKPLAIYDMVIGCVEKPLIEVVLGRVGGNQTQAARAARHEPQHAAQEDQGVRHQVALRRRPQDPLQFRRPHDNHPTGAHQRLRQDRRGRPGPAAGALRHRHPFHRGTAKPAAGRRAEGDRDRRVHRIPRDARRPRQDAPSQSPCGHPGAA